MSTNFILRLPGGICYAHGRFTENNCPDWPKCDTDPKRIDYMRDAGLNEQEIEEITGLECYCVCHSPLSNCVYCSHCKGDNTVGNFFRERKRLKDEVIHQAKEFFGSIDRKDTKALLEATGNLLIHEHSK